MYPVLLHIYGYELYTYPIIAFIGLLISAWFFTRFCRQKKIDIDLFSDHIFIIALVVLLFARLGGIAESFDSYLQNPIRLLYFFDGAYNFYSAIAGMLVVLFGLTFVQKENFWKWLDVITQSLLIFFIFLSLADFTSGGNYGSPSSLPWAITFNIPEVRYTVPVHPVQIYEAIGTFFLLIFSFTRTKKKYEDGGLASLMFFLFFLFQALLSFFHGEAETLIFGLKLSFLLALLFSTISLITFVFKTHPNIHFLNHHEES